MINAEDMLQAWEELKADYQANPPFWIVSPETYHTLQRIISQRPHQRLLRKCWLRKMYKRWKQDRRRYR